MKNVPHKSRKRPTYKQLIKALRFYANWDVYTNKLPSKGTTESWLETVLITKECGRLARKTLGIEDERDRTRIFDKYPDGVCYNCLNSAHLICEKPCRCRRAKHKEWWWRSLCATDAK